MGAHCGEFRMAARLRKRLTDEERRALQLLASSPCGHTEEVLVLAHGFDSDMLTRLVGAKLAKRYRVTVEARDNAVRTMSERDASFLKRGDRQCDVRTAKIDAALCFEVGRVICSLEEQTYSRTVKERQVTEPIELS